MGAALAPLFRERISLYHGLSILHRIDERDSL